jgi:NADPH2:quinone reductase
LIDIDIVNDRFLNKKINFMKAVHLVKYGNSDSAFEIREIPKPTPGPREVLIKVDAFGLNFADVVARRGLYPDAPKNPAVLGYDVAGTIESIGKDVNEFTVGDRVTALTRFGGYAEYVTTMVEGVASIPDGFDTGLSTALATQACTAYHCAVQSVNLHEGDKVLIHAAAGGVGSTLVQIAKSKGCIIYGTASKSKLAHIKSIGVDHAIDYRNTSFYDAVYSDLGGAELDFAFDSIGGKTFKQSYKLLKPGGTIVYFGAASQIGSNKLKALGVVAGFGLFSPIQLLMSSKSMIAVNMLRIADHKPALFQKIFSGVMDYVEQGIIKPTLAKKFSVDQIGEAHEYLESRQSIGKVVMEW